MRLREGDEVLAMGATFAGTELISVTENGYGKRSDLKQYPRKGRGGLGVIGHSLTKKTGRLAGAFIGSKDQDVFLVSSSGIAIRVPAGQIRRVGRASQGVRTMRVEEGAMVAAMAPVVMKEDDDEDANGPEVAGGTATLEAAATASTARPRKKAVPKAAPAKKASATKKPTAKRPAPKRRG